MYKLFSYLKIIYTGTANIILINDLPTDVQSKYHILQAHVMAQSQAPGSLIRSKGNCLVSLRKFKWKQMNPCFERIYIPH